MKKSRILPLAALGLLFASSASADEPDLFGRTGLYDLTGSPLIASIRLDPAGVKSGNLPGRRSATTTETRRNFFYVEDTDGTLRIPAQTNQDLNSWINFAAEELYVEHPDEFLFIYMFTSFNTRVGAFFYAPEANDAFGIGSQRFDSNGSSPREGFVFMNDWQSFEDSFGQAGPQVVLAQARSVFNQEAGHRWGAFTPIGPNENGTGTDVVLGRDDSHWSYFLHSGGSPMEGNAWRDNGNGSFSTTTTFQNWYFSDLDLYLMGLMPADEVRPFFAIMDPVVGNQRDLYGQALNSASPAQIINPITVQGTRVDLTIDHVTMRHGNRDPGFGESPNTWRVAFVMLAGQTSRLSESQKLEFERMVDEYAAGFHLGSRELGTLDYILLEEPKIPIGGVCESVDQCDPLTASVCLSPPERLCTRPCSVVDSCPTGWCCDVLSGAAAQVCLPEAFCPKPDPDPDPDPNTCACDTGEGCQADCACDTACVVTNPGALCACDFSYSCDMNAAGDGECACDPECDSGCGCSNVEAKTESAPRTPWLMLAAIALPGLWIAKRRRR